MRIKFLNRVEPYLPILPLLFLGFLFLAADLRPSTSPDEVGLVWQECRLATETYRGVPNWQQVERCFGHPSPHLTSGEVPVAAKEASRPLLVHVDHPYRLDGRLISIGKMGVKYFLMVDGHKVGPTFDEILVESCCEDALFSVNYGQGHYVFRGARGGRYYLVELSRD